MFLRNEQWPKEWLDDLTQKETKALRQLQDIGLVNLLNGYIPKLFKECQEDSFMLDKSKMSGNKWATQLVYNILKAKHNLCLQSRNIVNDKATGGLYMEENREINRLIQEELNRGTIGMEQQDFHLLKRQSKH